MAGNGRSWQAGDNSLVGPASRAGRFSGAARLAAPTQAGTPGRPSRPHVRKCSEMLVQEKFGAGPRLPGTVRSAKLRPRVRDTPPERLPGLPAALAVRPEPRVRRVAGGGLAGLFADLAFSLGFRAGGAPPGIATNRAPG